MNFKQRGALFLVLMTAFVLVSIVLDAAENGALAAPGRRGGGGGSRGSSSRGSSSRGSSWFGSSKPKSSSGGYKKKGSSTKSKLKKAAVIGAVAYGSYQIGKLSGKFSGYHGGYSWNQYNSWRSTDGFLCRNNNDCNWIDREFYCQDYELDFEPSALWFGGDITRIVGSCDCPGGMVFDQREMECKTAVFGSIGAIIGMVFVGILVLLCACGCCFFAARKVL